MLGLVLFGFRTGGYELCIFYGGHRTSHLSPRAKKYVYRAWGTSLLRFDDGVRTESIDFIHRFMNTPSRNKRR